MGGVSWRSRILLPFLVGPGFPHVISEISKTDNEKKSSSSLTA